MCPFNYIPSHGCPFALINFQIVLTLRFLASSRSKKKKKKKKEKEEKEKEKEEKKKKKKKKILFDTIPDWVFFKFIDI